MVLNHEQFGEEIEPSLEGIGTHQAEASRERWRNQWKWPHEYLQEAQDDFEYSDSLQRNLKRMGAGDHVEVARAYRKGADTTLHPIVNASIAPGWGQGWAGNGGSVRRLRVPTEDVIGIGHPEEGEVFVRTHRAKDIT